MLLGSGEGHCQSRPSIPLVNLSHSSPLGVSISEKIKNKIWNNEYIDVGFLLGENSTIDKLNLSVTLDSQLLSLVPNMRPQTIKSIDDWTSAFIVYVAIYTQRHQSEAPKLMKYMETVRDLSARGGLAYKIYDENFASHSNVGGFVPSTRIADTAIDVRSVVIQDTTRPIVGSRLMSRHHMAQLPHTHTKIMHTSHTPSGQHRGRSIFLPQ